MGSLAAPLISALPEISHLPPPPAATPGTALPPPFVHTAYLPYLSPPNSRVRILDPHPSEQGGEKGGRQGRPHSIL